MPSIQRDTCLLSRAYVLKYCADKQQEARRRKAVRTVRCKREDEVKEKNMVSVYTKEKMCWVVSTASKVVKVCRVAYTIG